MIRIWEAHAYRYTHMGHPISWAYSKAKNLRGALKAMAIKNIITFGYTNSV